MPRAESGLGGRGLSRQVLGSLLSVFLWALPASAFDQSDVKPVATLELLTENELVVEARTACRYLAVSHAIASQRAHLSDSALWLDAQNEQYQLALDYLSTISAVVQKLHNGTMPEWVNTMQAAVSNAEEKRCGDSVASPARE